MKNILYTIILFLFFSSSVFAEDEVGSISNEKSNITPGQLPYFKQICATENVDGLFWENGNWVSAPVKNMNIIIKKVPIPEKNPEGTDKDHLLSCWMDNYFNKQEDYPGHYKVCMVSQIIGEKHSRSGLCTEYVYAGGELVIYCNTSNLTMRFEPNGWIRFSNIEMFRPDTLGKYMYMGVGKCSDITE